MCVGVEYSAGRCEVWTRSSGIQASISLTGFVCLGYVAEEAREPFGMIFVFSFIGL